jgi:hypothetical protein
MRLLWKKLTIKERIKEGQGLKNREIKALARKMELVEKG